ncbi:MAG: glycosyltransferase family 2 protein [Phycisphaerales bacterium]|nr:MAG: glycosyltransferase family 2 protein [Phycisphaerales bacterium]
MLSVVIITLNEEARIGACLESVAWADEIVVVDSYSNDKTVEIARGYTEKIYQKEFVGFGEQKSYALQKAKGDWILSIDADEKVTDELRDEIKRTLADPRACGYYVPRRFYLSNRRMRHSQFWPEYKLRLFRRDRGRFSNRMVHERVEVEGRTAKLKCTLEHHTYCSVSTLIKKADTYSTLGAQAMLAEGKRCTGYSALGHSFAAFVKTYFLRLGILDGWMGLAIAYSNAASAFYKYIKCLELKNQQDR